MPSDFSLTYTQTMWLPVKEFVTYTTYKPLKKKKKSIGLNLYLNTILPHSI